MESVNEKKIKKHGRKMSAVTENKSVLNREIEKLEEF